MKKHNLYRGFTIIEVVLVLAIAGLIFLMVFLGLPALQRSQRDTQRKQDVSLVITALHEWKSNNRGRGYASLGQSSYSAIENNDKYNESHGIKTQIGFVENNPLHDYIGFERNTYKNKENGSSNVSLNISVVTTAIASEHNSKVRVYGNLFKSHERIAIVVNAGCDSYESPNGDDILLKRKIGAAAVTILLESGGAYCQEA